MLVLSRRKGEAIMLGGEINLVVLEIRGDNVRLGFEAPTELPIFRKEVVDREPKCLAVLAAYQSCHADCSSPTTNP